MIELSSKIALSKVIAMHSLRQTEHQH